MSEFVTAFFDSFFCFPEVISIAQAVGVLVLLDGVIRFLFGTVNRYTGGK